MDSGSRIGGFAMNARVLLAVLSVTFSVHVNAAASSKYTTTPIGTAQAISFQDALPDVILAGQQGVHQLFGGFVASDGDVNGDGYDDFAVTASRFSDCRGRAYLYFGGRDRIYGNADHIFDGETAGDVFGKYIILADLKNDIDGDHLADMVGSACSYPGKDDVRIGRACVYYTKLFAAASDGMQPQFVQ
jgi:hypothetical protein